MKKLTKTVVGVIVLVAVVFVYILFFNKAQAPQVVAPGQTIPTSWKTYTDTVSGISLQAPADFVVENHNSAFSDANLFLLVIPTSTPYVHTHLLHEALIAVDVPTSTCPIEETLELSASSTQITINSVAFTRTLTGGVGAGNIYQGIDYTTTRNNLCYRVTLFTHSTNGEGFYTGDTVQIKKIDALQAMDIKDLFTLFDQIAGTLKFSK
jgi:hypothetical protein